MSYEYDKRLLRSAGRRGYGGFGYDQPSAGADLTQYVLVPRCVLPSENTLVDVANIWPRFFWSTFISGAYATGAASRWLRSIGCDPISAVVQAPATFSAHTFPTGDGVSFPTKTLFTLSSDLLASLDRLPMPENADPPGWYSMLSEFRAAIQSKNEAALQSWSEQLRLIIDGYKHGLCVWPPAQFRNQEHLDAWVAHYLEWRYGWDTDGGMLWLKGVNPPYPSSNRNLGYRADYAGGEGSYVETPLMETSIKRVWESTIKTWPRVAQDECLKPDPRPMYGKSFFRLSLDDKELGSKLLVLHTLLCVQMAYYAEAKGVTDAFPGAKYLPHTTGSIGSTIVGFLQALSSVASSFVLGAGAASPFKAIQGVLQTQVTNIVKSAMDPGQSLAGLPLPTLPQWQPVPVHISVIAGLPSCKAVSAPLTPAQRILQSGVDLTITTPATQAIPRTLAQRILDSGVDLTITTPMTIKPGTRGYIEVVKAKQQSSLLLPALGIGGALLLMKLLKKKG